MSSSLYQEHLVSSSNSGIEYPNLQHVDLDALNFRATNLLADIIDTVSLIDQNIASTREKLREQSDILFKELLQRIITECSDHLSWLTDLEKSTATK